MTHAFSFSFYSTRTTPESKHSAYSNWNDSRFFTCHKHWRCLWRVTACMRKNYSNLESGASRKKGRCSYITVSELCLQPKSHTLKMQFSAKTQNTKYPLIAFPPTTCRYCCYKLPPLCMKSTLQADCMNKLVYTVTKIMKWATKRKKQPCTTEGLACV